MGLEMKYFVLKPRGTDQYAKASRAAIRQYAKLIRDEDEVLYMSLMEWAQTETEKAGVLGVSDLGEHP